MLVEMIIIRMLGGLGNQLFQYALGRRLSLDRHVPLKLDLSWYATQSSRSYQLDRFTIEAQFTNRSEIQALTHALQQDTSSLFFRLSQRFLPFYQRRRVYERRPGYDQNIILKTSRRVYLDGYWQSEKYFTEIANILRKDLRLRDPLHPINADYAQQIRSNHAISLHIRRGDYLEPHYSKVFYHCDEAYYRNAMDLMLRNYPDAHFFVFSDDPEWAKQNLSSYPKISYVENYSVKRDWELIYLMSLCRHHIIANSSFSWWGAWLNENPDKMVIAPQKWFVSPQKNTADLIPSTWVRL
jgi:hypothetical protein